METPASGAPSRRGSEADPDRFPVLTTLERSTGVKKRYIALGGIAMGVLVVFFGTGMRLFADFFVIIYPVVATFKAVNSPSEEVVQDLLTYWVVWGLFTTVDTFSDFLLSWLPVYNLLKFVLLAWSLLPGSQGAKVIYRMVLKPIFVRHRNRIDSTLERTQSTVSMTLDRMFFTKLRAASGSGRELSTASASGDDVPSAASNVTTPRGIPAAASPLAQRPPPAIVEEDPVSPAASRGSDNR